MGYFKPYIEVVAASLGLERLDADIAEAVVEGGLLYNRHGNHEKIIAVAPLAAERLRHSGYEGCLGALNICRTAALLALYDSALSGSPEARKNALHGAVRALEKEREICPAVQPELRGDCYADTILEGLDSYTRLLENLDRRRLEELRHHYFMDTTEPPASKHIWGSHLNQPAVLFDAGGRTVNIGSLGEALSWPEL